ncbi:RICIN domain-containing protein [Microbulbifer rhizosphaerae]|uniref:RICIN domain-containing protein n=1 Tax=Microbulbifer rhizosphaerae TaxID=1562603 RepID=UPI001FE91F07|nr:RICIN domain-containing protein [Microbulbifer rhizosphaerae]
MSIQSLWRACSLVGTCAFLVLNSPAYALENGTYTITSKHSEKLVEVGNGDTAEGANINQWPANGHPTQHWIITHISDSNYSVINGKQQPCHGGLQPRYQRWCKRRSEDL